MADKKQDSPNYIDPDSFRAQFWDAASFRSGKTSVFIAGAVAAPLLAAGAINAPLLLQDHVDPKADNDIYTGITNDEQRYSYAANLELSNGTEDYFLLEKDGIFRIYMKMPGDPTRLLLIEDKEQAQAIATEMTSLLKARIAEINSSNMNPVNSFHTNFATCNYVSLPFEYFGDIERHKDGCPWQEVQAHEASDVYAENIALWERAAETLAQDGVEYGPQADDMIELGSTSPLGQFVKETGQEGLGLSLMILLGAAGVATSESRKRRRKSKKDSQPRQR